MFVSTRLLVLLLFLAGTLSAQEIVFQTTFDDDDSSGFLELSNSDDTLITFGYDYIVFDEIPEAPNTEMLGGEDNLGLKMEANLTQGADTSAIIVTDGLDLSGNYEVQVDIWLNFNPPASGPGTTEFGGVGVGHDGETEGFSGASFIYDTDGDSSRDYRIYKDDAETIFDSEFGEAGAGQFLIDSQNNTGADVSAAFPGVDLSQALTTDFLEGFTPDGTGSYRWMTLNAVVDSNIGTATFSLTDEETGNSLDIATLDSNAADGPVDMSGEVALLFRDIFASVGPNDGVQNFGIFDNLIITQLPDAADPLDCSGDGAVDGMDVACATPETIGDTLAAAGFLAGDFNLDGAVAVDDFLILSRNFNNADLGGVYANGDADLNGSINVADFLQLSQNFGATAAVAAVPEPQGIALMLFGGSVALGTLRRRR